MNIVQQMASALLFAAIASAQVQPLTDARISELAQKGVHSDELVQLIRTAPSVDFDLTPTATDGLIKAGVSEDVIKAMAAREISPPALRPIAQTQTVAPERHSHKGRNLILIGIAAGGLAYLGYALSNPSAAAPPCISCSLFH